MGAEEIRSVQPGDVVIFEDGGEQFGGTVWRSPTTGDLLAGDTFLTLSGEWIATDDHVVQIIRKVERLRLRLTLREG